MPAKIKVRIVAARHLPVMDRSSELTDAFVEVKFGSNTYKTEVYRKSLNPQWNSDWYRFEVDDEDLQDEPLQLKVLDHDTYSSHDAIGKVYIDLNPLLTRDHNAMISGWFPIYDTMHGIRGELNVVVKIDLFSDFNKFRQSSCGVQFFCTSGVPHGYQIHAMHGFVEELVVNDDPEHQWIDKVRSQRSSNEARQVLFSKLSGELQRKIGLKVLEAGGNSVLGYRQCFDLEGETGVVVRAIGTVVSLAKSSHYGASANSLSPGGKDFPLPEDVVVPSSPTKPNAPTTPAKDVTKVIRRSSDSDIGTPPKVGSLGGSSGSGGCAMAALRPLPHKTTQQQSIEMLEYPFFTIKSFPAGFLVHLGGVVSARSIKLLDRIHNPDEPETRDNWWAEIRTEIMSHAKLLGCHAVVGYMEYTTICEETIVLSAMGTAALVNIHFQSDLQTVDSQKVLASSLDRSTFDKLDQKKHLHVDINLANQLGQQKEHSPRDTTEKSPNCALSHIPYNESSPLFSSSISRCASCKRHRVPDLLLTTVEPPQDFEIKGRGCLIQARICRAKKEGKGESNAKDICDNITFMEYELNKQLVNKLKIKGMNTMFGLKTQVVIGERLIIALATGTAVFAPALPVAQCPTVAGNTDDVSVLQSRLIEAFNKNRIFFNVIPSEETESGRTATEDIEEDFKELDLSSINKDTFVLEIDDAQDASNVNALLDPLTCEGFDLCTTEIMPGVSHIACNLQMFTRIYRCRLPAPNNQEISTMFDDVLKGLCFKLRRTTPCCLGHLDFDIEIHDEDEIQVSVTGICMGVGEPPTKAMITTASSTDSETKMNIYKQASQISGNSADGEEMLFLMEEDEEVTQSDVKPPPRSLNERQAQDKAGTTGGAKPKRIRYYSGSQQRGKQGIEITPLSYVPGGRIEQFLGHLNFFIIRETTSVRECGGLNGFMHSFVSEVMAICRSHVMSFGGNTLVAYQLSECVLDDNLHKNQSQSLVNVCGDVVQVVYDGEGLHHHQTPHTLS